MTEIDPLTEHSRTVWSAAATAWSDQASAIDDRCAPITEAMLDAAGVARGMRVLELAGGPGGVGLEAARRVGADGAVLITDVVEAMVETAAQRAAHAGLTVVETAVVALDAIDLPEVSFDAVVCREGLMFAADYGDSLAGMARVLVPGGRVAVAVWAEPARNPWLAVLIDSVSGVLGFPVPPPGIPGPFSLADEARLTTLLRSAGFVDVAVQVVAVPSRDASFDEYWTNRLALAGPLAALVGGLPDEQQAAMRAAAEAAAAPYRTAAGGYDFPGHSLVASGTRPGA